MQVIALTILTSIGPIQSEFLLLQVGINRIQMLQEWSVRHRQLLDIYIRDSMGNIIKQKGADWGLPDSYNRSSSYSRSHYSLSPNGDKQYKYRK